VAEGAPLLRAYRLIPIEGSNPSLSAIYLVLPNPFSYKLKSRFPTLLFAHFSVLGDIRSNKHGTSFLYVLRVTDLVGLFLQAQ
jgi:hypothetical protein